jgi:hypothetical protein
MFLKSVTELTVDFDEVRAAMLHRPHRWLEDLADSAGHEGDRLLVDVGLELGGHEIRRRARLELGDPVSTDRIASLPLRLRAQDHERLFPELEGSLDAAWLGPGRTHLALMVRYEPPFGAVGRAVDRALLHRVAEAIAQRFTEAVAWRLSTRPSAKGGAPGAGGHRRARP